MRSADARKLLGAASAAWRVQAGAADEEDAEDSWEAQWLGQDIKPSALPTLYVFLPPAALPRGAIVEWQLTAHDGRAAQGVDQEIEHCEEDDEQELSADRRAALEDLRDEAPEEAGPPRVTSGSQTFTEGSRVAYRVVKSVRGRSSFGIACCLVGDGASEKLGTALVKPMRDALSVRVLYRAVGERAVSWSQGEQTFSAPPSFKLANSFPSLQLWHLSTP